MQTIKLNQIQPYALQPAGRARDTTDLQESHLHIGILRPPIIVPDGDGQYVCLAGWRTITAAKAMGLKEMLCIVRGDLVNDHDKQAAVFMQSNLHKELTSLERGYIIKTMVDNGRDLRHCARQMGVSTTLATHLHRLATAPLEIQELVKKGGRGRDGLSFSTFRAELAALSNEQMVERLQEAGDLSRKALKRARQKAGNKAMERLVESLDDIMVTIQGIRRDSATVEVFMRTTTEFSAAEVREAMRPIYELWEEVVG